MDLQTHITPEQTAQNLIDERQIYTKTHTETPIVVKTPSKIVIILSRIKKGTVVKMATGTFTHERVVTKKVT